MAIARGIFVFATLLAVTAPVFSQEQYEHGHPHFGNQLPVEYQDNFSPIDVPQIRDEEENINAAFGLQPPGILPPFPFPIVPEGDSDNMPEFLPPPVPYFPDSGIAEPKQEMQEDENEENVADVKQQEADLEIEDEDDVADAKRQEELEDEDEVDDVKRQEDLEVEDEEETMEDVKRQEDEVDDENQQENDFEDVVDTDNMKSQKESEVEDENEVKRQEETEVENEDEDELKRQETGFEDEDNVDDVERQEETEVEDKDEDEVKRQEAESEDEDDVDDDDVKRQEELEVVDEEEVERQEDEAEDEDADDVKRQEVDFEDEENSTDVRTPKQVSWVPCDTTTTAFFSCYDCHTRLQCKASIGGKLIPCYEPMPYCNQGVCSAIPSDGC